MTALKYTAIDLDIATRTLFGECRGEPDEGRVAVMWVIRNRAEHPGWWGKSVAGVCLAKSQFSCWNMNDPNREKLKAVPAYDPVYTALQSVVERVLNGEVPDPTGGASHYEVIGTGAAWAKDRKPDAVIGHHAFYCVGLGRLKQRLGGWGRPIAPAAGVTWMRGHLAFATRSL
jgi:N-acetylmuramoyl-L-alanine amidase